MHIELNNIETIISGLHIGVVILDKWKRKICTTYTEIINQKALYTLQFPSIPLLSGLYSFDAAIFVPNGPVFEYIKDICPIEIIDYTSDLSLYGDADVGVVSLNNTWV